MLGLGLVVNGVETRKKKQKNNIFFFFQLAKQQVAPNGEKIPFGKRVVMAAVAGGLGGIVGTPGDMVNVRMQNDVKLPAEQRRKWVEITIIEELI